MRKLFVLLSLIFLVCGCATYKSKYADREGFTDIQPDKEIAHTFYLIGDAGMSPIDDMNPVLKAFRKRLAQARTLVETARGIEIYLGVTALYMFSAFGVNRVMAFIERRIRVPGLEADELLLAERLVDDAAARP